MKKEKDKSVLKHLITFSKALEGEISLVGTFPLTMHIRVPNRFQLDRVEGNELQSSAKMISENILAITYMSKTTGNFAFNISFNCRKY